MRKQYISSLKGIACLFVALGHFFGTIKYASGLMDGTAFFTLLNQYRLGFILNESFWLYLFFVVSGYLMANSQVKTVKQVFVRSVTRFLRFALPVFVVCVFIFLFNKIAPFYNRSTTVFFENNWLQSAYSIGFSVRNLLSSSIDILFVGKMVYNSTYWVLRYMMFTSFFIYFLTYVRSKDKTSKFFWPIALLLSIGSLHINEIFVAGLVGALLCYYEAELKKLFKSKALLVTCGLLALMLCFFQYIIGGIAVFSWLIIALPKLTTARKILETKVFNFIGNISFGIYSFHWPVFCSVGCYVIISLWDKIGGGMQFFALA